jgi:hypothetical protein
LGARVYVYVLDAHNLPAAAAVAVEGFLGCQESTLQLRHAIQMLIHKLAAGDLHGMLQTLHGCRVQCEELCGQGALDRVGKRSEAVQKGGRLRNLTQALLERFWGAQNG